MEDFETVKAISGSVGLLIFIAVFAGACFWAFRPGSGPQYRKYAESILNEDNPNG